MLRDTGEALAERAARWRPALADPVHAPLIRSLALAAEPVDWPDAGALLSALSGMAYWLERTGVPISRAVMTEPATIARFVADGRAGDSAATRRACRVLLERVSAAERGASRLRATRRRPRDQRAEAPYADHEVDALLSWADGQRSDLKRHSLLVVLATGLGAGLTNTDLRAVRGRHVTAAPDGAVTVAVPGPAARDVTVLRRYEALLARLAADAGDDWLLAPGLEPIDANSVAAQWLEAQKRATVVPLTVRRCRATWMTDHLARGTRLDVLAAAAGLDDAQELVQHRLPQLVPQNPVDALAALRRAEHQPDPSEPPQRTPAAAERRPPPVLAPLPPAAQAHLNRYRSPLSDERHVPLVRVVAAAAGPRTASAAGHAGSAAADLVAWAERHGHPTGTSADVLDRAVVDAWAAAPDGAGRWQARTRIDRTRMVEQAVAVLNPAGAHPPDGTGAYTRHDIDALLKWAEGQQNPALRWPLLAVLAVGLGAGLRPGEYPAVTGRSITRDASTGAVLLAVTDGGLSRTVAALREHEDLLARAADRAGTAWIVDPSNTSPRRRDAERACRAIPRAAGVPVVNPLRLRLTWIRAHLASGTRADTVQRAAGLASHSHLHLWAAALDPLPVADGRAMLRGD